MKQGRYLFRFVLTVLLAVSCLLMISLNREAYFTKEIFKIPFDPSGWEYDTEWMKYQIAIQTDCLYLETISVQPDTRVTSSDMILQTVLPDGKKEDTQVNQTELIDDGTLIFHIDGKMIKNVNHTAYYDLCLKKEHPINKMEIQVVVYNRFLLVLLLIGLLMISVAAWMLIAIHKGQILEVRWPAGLLLILASSALLFLSFEVLGNERLNEMSAEDIAGNMIIGTLTIFLVSLLMNSVRNAVILCMAAGMLGAFVNYFLLQFRGQPLQPADFLSIRTALNVAGRYEYTVNWRLITLCIINLVWIIHFIWIGPVRYTTVIKRLFLCLGSLLIICISIYSLYYTQLGKLLLPEPSYWNAKGIYESFGFGKSFLSYGSNLIPPEISGYTKEAVTVIAASVPEMDAGEDEGKAIEDREKAGEGVKRPNILVIMNEAMADFRLFENFEASETSYAFWDSLQKNCIKGFMQIPVYAGGTANTEYEFLTGNSMTFFNGSGVPYTMIPEKLNHSLAKTLASQGYETIAMHPNTRTNYNRNIVYPRIGFQEFLSTDNYFSDTERLRGLISDYGNYSKIIDWMDSRESEEPFFLFDITMQNHSDYTSQMIPISVYYTKGMYPDVNEYLTLLKESDRALEYLINELKTRDKTVLVIFGDHLPALNQHFMEEMYSGEHGDDDNIIKTYSVPLMIWANYDLRETMTEDFQISSNYLGAFLLQMLGLEMTGYERFLINLYQEYPVVETNGYMDSSGEFHLLSLQQQLPQKLQEYRLLQYDQLYGREWADIYERGGQ